MASYKAIVEMMDKRPGKKKHPGVDPEREALQRVRDQILGNDDRTVRLRRDGGETGYGSLDDLNEYWASFNDRLHQAVDDYDTVGYGNASSLYTKHQVRFGNLDKHLNTLRNWAQWLADRGEANERLVSQINGWIDAHRGDVSNVMEAFREANDYYSQWDTEEAFNAYKIQAGEFDHIENFDADSEAGWDAYQTDAQQEQDAFARALAMVGGTDAMSPAGSFASAMNTFRADDSDKKPNDNWTDAQKSYFGYLYQTDREKAWEYAQQINSEMAYQAQATAREQIRENAVEHPVANTLGALGTAPFGLADYLTDLAEYSATGEIGQKGTVSPFDYSQEVTGGIAQNLNEKFGTLNDSIPLIGGKGWGDVYGLGTSIAQSALSAHTLGSLGTLVQFFGSAGAAGIDEAKRRGASDDQAVVYGTLLGLAEGVAEQIGVENLLKIGSFKTLRGFIMKSVLKQARAEGLEEGITSLMNNFSDQLVMADKSNFYIKVQAYMNNGLSEEEAKWRVWMDMAEDIAFDMIGGFVSGGIHAGPQTAIKTYQQYKNESAAQQAEEADAPVEQFEEEVPVQPVKEPVVPVQPQRTEAPVRQAEVPAQQVQKPVATVQPQRTEAPANQTVVPAQQEADPVRQLADQVSAEQTAPKQETAPANTEDASRKAQPLPGQENAPATGTVDAQNKEVVQKPSVAETVPGKVRSIASIKDGRMMLEAEDGSTIDSSEVSYGSLDEANVYGAVSELDGIIDTTTANKLSKHLMKLGNSSSEVYSRGIVQAYTYGYYGYSRDAMTGEKTLSATLTEEQRNVAYGYGEQYRKAKITADQANARKGGIRKKATGKENATAPDGTQYKKVRFEGEITHWSDKRKAEVAFMDFIASNFSGNTVHVIESYKDSDGRYVYKDNNGNVKTAPNGMYEPSTGDMYIDLNAGAGGDGLVMNTFAHEMFHHIKRRSPAKAQKLAEFIAQELGYENVEAAVRRQINLAERSNHGVASFVEEGMSESAAERLVYDRAYEDFIANSLETMFTEGDVVSKLQKLKSQDKNLFTMIKEFIDQWVQKLRKFYSGHRTLSIEGDMVAHLEKFEQIQQMFVEALVDAGENYQASLIPGEEGTVVNGNGDPVALATEDGSVLLSMRTYEEDGRKAFRDYLQKCVTSDKLTKAEMQEMIDGIEEIYQTCKEFKDKYAPFGSWSDAAVVRDTHGRPVFSVVTPNGDYKMNLDFSLVCKKRRTLDAVFNEMSRRGIIDDFELGQKSVVKINEIIRKHGLETACALCFVDAKRFRQASMADSFVRLYNELVESLVPADQRSSIDHFNFAGYETIRKVDSGIDTWANSELDFSHLDYVMKNYEKGTVEHKAARYIKTHPEGRRLLLRGDFMSSKGFDAVKTQNMDVMKLYNSKKGTGGPKAAFGDVQYMNEIINKARTWTPAKAYAVGGIRIQSFSDYVPRMVFDYTQMIYDLAATKLPAHAYTKEALFVKQFGLTGVKINMSLIPAIAEGGVAPGLDANGDYVWAGESFDFETAKEIQNAEGYTENCGTICVGVSKQHIVKLLSDPDIRMVIPYHKSGLNPIVAHMNKIGSFTDYTSLKTNPGGCQSTIDKNGNKVENDFNFNEVLRKTGDPKATVRQYLDWCAKNGHTPRFAEFAWHENYYKLIEDFTLYDKDGNYVPQREVRAVFPKEGSAFGSMKDLIQEGLEEDAVVEGKRDSSLSSIVDEIQDTLPRTEDEIAEDQVAQADHDLEADVKYSDRDYLSAVNRGDVSTARKMVDEAAKNAGYTPVTRWHQTGENFTRFSTDNPVAGLNDSETPNGIFFKTNDHDIGLEGKKQMPLYLKLNNALHFANRREANAWYREKVPGYGKLHQEYDEAIKPLSERMDELEDQIFATDDDDEIAALEAKEDETLGEMKSIEDDFRARLRRLLDDYFLTGKSGYDGIELDYDGHRWVNGKREDVHTFIAFHPSQAKSADPVTYDDSGNVIPLSERFSQASDDIRYSDRDTESVSNRSLLANAFEGAAQTDKEREKIQEYRGQIDLIQAEEQKLRELNAQIRDLSFAKGKRDTQKIRELRDQATETANRISVYDQQLLRLEASKPLQDMLAREKKRAYQQAEQRHKEAQEAYRLKAEVRQSEILRDYRETRAALRQSQSETALMEKEFIRLVKAYEKLEAKSTAKSGKDTQTIADLKAALKEEAKAHRQDQTLWEAEFNRLMREYEASDRNIEKLQAKIEKQKKEAQEKLAKVRETAEKRDARSKLQNLVVETYDWVSGKKKSDVKCPDMLKQPYADFLNSIDMSSERLAKGGDPTKNDLRMANAMSSLATALERIMASQDPTQETTAVLDAGYLDLPPHFVQKLREMTETVQAMMVEGEYVVNNMTAEEVRQLSQMIRSLNHAIREVSTLYANLRFANVEMLGGESMSFMEELGEIQKTGGAEAFVLWENALPFYAFKRFGKGGESVFEGLMDAQDKLAFLAQKIFDFQEKTWTGSEAKKWSEDTHTINLPDGEKLTLTTADAMSIYCLSRRQQGLQHLLGGGVRVMGIQKGSQKAKDSRSTLTIRDIVAIKSSLTGRQKQVAEAIQEFMSTICSEWGNEISMKRFLTREFGEKFYFPIESNDENLPTKDPSAQQSDLFRLLNISATKPIDPRANNEVIIRNIFDVFTGHASDMARLNAFGLPLLDYMKWLNYREKTTNEDGQINVRGVRKFMEKAYGIAAKNYVLNLVKDVNGRPSDNGDPTMLMKWMRSAKTASVGSSLRVATLQITSYPRAALVLSPKSLALGLTKIPRIEKAKKYCGIALWKSFGFYDTNISRSIEDQMKGVKDVKQKMIELSLKGAEIGDAITWGAMWNACEYEVAATKKYKVGTEEFYQAVGKKLREVVYRTQVVDSTLTRSQIMRSKRGMAQEAAAFMSEPTLSANILMDAGTEFSLEQRRTNAKTAWKKTGKYVTRSLAVYSIGQLTAALMEGLWDAWRDDEDEEFSEKFLSAFKGNLLLDLVPFNKLPIVSDVFEAVLAMFDAGYYSSDKMSTTWLTQAVSAADAWRDVLGGESSVTAYNALYKTVRALSSFVGVSFSGAMREAVALWNNTAGAYDATLKVLNYDRSKAELGGMLLDAIIDGNSRQADSIRAEFADEDAYQSAIRTAIKERYKSGEIDYNTALDYLIDYGGMDEDDAYWKAEEWAYENETGEDFGKFDDFLTAVQTGQNLKAVIQQYTDNGVEPQALADQIRDHFKPMYMKMSTAERANIKGYLLNAYELCGVERDKAQRRLGEWEFESKCGIPYSDAKEAFWEGSLSAADYKAAIISCEGKTGAEACERIADACKDGYLEGMMSRADAAKLLVSYGGMSSAEAESAMRYYDAKLQYPDLEVQKSWVDKYYSTIKTSGISMDTYLEYRNNCVGVSKKDEKLLLIDRLPISKKQKDALYLAEGWAESKLGEAPWH